MSPWVLKQGVQLTVELFLPMQKLWEALLNMEPKGKGGEVGSVHLREYADGRFEERVVSVDVRTHTLISKIMSPGAAKSISVYTKTMALSSARDGTTTIARWRAECVPPVEGAASPLSDASDHALLFFKALEAYLTSSSPAVENSVPCSP